VICETIEERDGLSRRDLLRRGAIGGAAVIGAGQLVGGGGISLLAPASADMARKPRSGGTLMVAASGGGSQDSLDPNLVFDDPALIRSNNLYETLTKTNLNYELENVLATEFSSSKRGTVWTVRIRRGVRFHNGKDFTAEDVLFSFQRVMNTKSGSTVAASLQWLNLKKSRVLDSHTVQFVCDHAVGPFAQAISQVTMLPVGYNPKTAIGTGPFKLVSFTPGDRSVFARFEDYWGQPAYLDQLVTIDYPDPSSAVNALSSGEVDVLSSVPISEARVVSRDGTKLLIGQLGRPLLLDMRSDKPPFDDVRVRQAFRLIADRKQILEQAFDGFGAVGNDMYSPWDPAYRHDLPQRTQDIEKAKSLLKQAGQSKLTVNLPTAPVVSGLDEMCLVFKQQAEAAGVTINVQQVDPATYEGRDYGVATFVPDFDSNLPYLQLSGLFQLPGAPFNAPHWDDPQYTKLYNQALAELDDTKRIGVEREMELIQYERGDYILPVHGSTVDAYSSKVGGFVNNAKVVQPLNNAYFQPVYLT
jgi:peptide/nickel transport system substrate-binding protein